MIVLAGRLVLNLSSFVTFTALRDFINWFYEQWCESAFQSVGQNKDFSVSWEIQITSASILTFTGLKRERCVGSAKEIYLRDNKQR